MPRYPQGILVACPSPWDEKFELVEELLREEVRRVLAAGYKHCYVFGTGGEGYAVDTRRFRQVVDVFHEETSGRPPSKTSRWMRLKLDTTSGSGATSPALQAARPSTSATGGRSEARRAR